VEPPVTGREIAALQVQVTELGKDLTALQLDTRVWQKQHHIEHQTERRERIAGRRWVVGTLIAVLVLLVAVLGLVLSVAARIR